MSKKAVFIIKVLNALREDPGLFILRFISLFYKIYLRMKRTVKIGQDLILKGMPLIQTINGGRIIIGNNVTLYSSNRQYFANLCSPVKLLVDQPGAVINIGDNSRINGACIHATQNIFIGKNCLIAANTSIIDSDGHDLCLDKPDKRFNSSGISKPIIIEDFVWIGLNCVITKGVTIGYGSVIGANSVVKSDIPSHSLAAGNPARVIRGIKNEQRAEDCLTENSTT